MNKEQSADDPSVDLIRVKNMLNSTISKGVVRCCNCMYRTYVSLEAFSNSRQWREAHDNNMKDYTWWLTDHHNC